jgi:hypothetical protein
VTLPEDINDRFNPTTEVAGMFVRPDPFPKKDPEKDPLPCRAKEEVAE